MPSLEIALATHNSARYLPELLRSLMLQTSQQFTVLVADDDSTDETPKILAEYRDRYPDRFRILSFTSRAGGARSNFARLMEHLSADYVMFCDHDDVWLPGKIALSLDAIHQLEQRHGGQTPLLFHTDLTVTGPDLEVLDASYWAYTNIDPSRNKLSNLFIQNTAMGCTSILNRALYERARPIPPQARMHDSWISLVATAFGKIEYSPQSTILYRLHAGNVAGARKWNAAHILRRTVDTLSGRNLKFLAKIIAQARVFLDQYGPDLPPNDRETTMALANLLSRSRWSRWWPLLHFDLFANGLPRNLGIIVMAVILDERKFELLNQ